MPVLVGLKNIFQVLHTLVRGRVLGTSFGFNGLFAAFQILKWISKEQNRTFSKF